MQSIINLYSNIPNEIDKFLNDFYGNTSYDTSTLSDKKWQKEYPNPVEAVDIIGAYIENLDKYQIAMWLSIDNGVFIRVTEENADELIRYLYERFPY